MSECTEIESSSVCEMVLSVTLTSAHSERLMPSDTPQRTVSFCTLTSVLVRALMLKACEFSEVMRKKLSPSTLAGMNGLP